MNYTALSDKELLSKLIGVRSSRRLYHGSLKPLFSEQDNPLHEKCTVARELVSRWLSEDMEQRCVLSAPGAVKDYLRLFFAGREYESFVVLFLDAQNRLITATEIFRGTLTQTSVYPREIVKEALRQNAGAVIFSHNHPSGVSEPSRADEMLTQNLKTALALVDVKVLDHFIVAGATTLSFAERGLL
jgi:DNA repair protein RadC